MRLFAILPYYFLWHYSDAPKSVVKVTRNFLWFFWHFFSVGVMARTLFTPWQRITEKTQHRLDFREFFEVHMINGIMRGVGFVVRMIMIALGFAILAIIALLGIVALLIWLVMPALIVALLISGIALIIKAV